MGMLKDEKRKTGDCGEFLVLYDLTKKGFELFAPMNNGSLIDIVAIKNDTSFKIQVKASNKILNDKLVFDIRRSNNVYSENSFDVLALVDTVNNKVAYLKWEEMYSRSTIKMRTSDYNRNFHSPHTTVHYFDDHLEFPYRVNEPDILVAH